MKADIPYQPVLRNRKVERERAAKLPGYTEARQKAADEFQLFRQVNQFLNQ